MTTGSRLQTGRAMDRYDLPASLATYMIVSGWATAVAETGAMLIPLDDVESISLAQRIRQLVKARRKGKKRR